MSLYIHQETGGKYVVICEAKRQSDQAQMIVYRKVGTDEKWVRPASEFFYGRFAKQDLFAVEEPK